MAGDEHDLGSSGPRLRHQRFRGGDVRAGPVTVRAAAEGERAVRLVAWTPGGRTWQVTGPDRKLCPRASAARSSAKATARRAARLSNGGLVALRNT